MVDLDYRGLSNATSLMNLSQKADEHPNCAFSMKVDHFNFITELSEWCRCQNYIILSNLNIKGGAHIAVAPATLLLNKKSPYGADDEDFSVPSLDVPFSSESVSSSDFHSEIALITVPCSNKKKLNRKTRPIELLSASFNLHLHEDVNYVLEHFELSEKDFELSEKDFELSEKDFELSKKIQNQSSIDRTDKLLEKENQENARNFLMDLSRQPLDSISTAPDISLSSPSFSEPSTFESLISKRLKSLKSSPLSEESTANPFLLGKDVPEQSDSSKLDYVMPHNFGGFFDEESVSLTDSKETLLLLDYQGLKGAILMISLTGISQEHPREQPLRIKLKVNELDFFERIKAWSGVHGFEVISYEKEKNYDLITLFRC